jgi:hypothetical protein
MASCRPFEDKNPVVIGRLGHDPTKPTVTFYGHYVSQGRCLRQWLFDIKSHHMDERASVVVSELILHQPVNMHDAPSLKGCSIAHSTLFSEHRYMRQQCYP